MVMLRCPYDEPRDVPWLNRTGERAVEPDELVDIPDELAENFLEAGWINPAAEAKPKPRGGKKNAEQAAQKQGGDGQEQTDDGQAAGAQGSEG